MNFPTIKQLNKFDCGPACLQIILKYYKINYSIAKLKTLVNGTNGGSSMLDLSAAAQKLGFNATGSNLTIKSLMHQQLPCILHWDKQHYVVLYKITGSFVYISDPYPGLLIKYTHNEFLQHWSSPGIEHQYGSALLLSPSSDLKRLRSEQNKNHISFILKTYVIPFRSFYGLIIIGMLMGLLLSFVTPFLTKSVVDIGIEKKDLNFINLILLAQLVTALSSVILSGVRSWIFLHMGWQMNFSALSGFLDKMLKLPISYFDSSQIGDILQRISDHSTLKMFVSATSFSILFSFFNLVVFGGILAYYNITIFLIFITSSVVYILWVTAFMRRRKQFDYKVFSQNASGQNKLIQMFSGIKDIKLNNFEQLAKKEWETIQKETFVINARQMRIGQYQQAGSVVIDTAKSIFISYLTAKLVIQGQMTLGMMLSIQYMLGQLNLPIAQFVSFNNSLQDAKISVERIQEIYDRGEEYTEHSQTLLSVHDDIVFEGLSFKYAYASASALTDITLTIPKGKTTAIIGTSGSGKSTLLKILLRFYHEYTGNITIGNQELKNIDLPSWRDQCCSVLQDGFIFNDSVLHNIAYSGGEIDKKKAIKSATLANIHDFIMSLPEGYLTVLGTQVNSLSQGQKQRLLIARAIYKNASYVLLDEPTAGLDTHNERIVTNNLKTHFEGKTVIIVAHRLSTITEADNIIVLDNGKIAEQGNHRDLINQDGIYNKLLKSID